MTATHVSPALPVAPLAGALDEDAYDPEDLKHLLVGMLPATCEVCRGDGYARDDEGRSLRRDCPACEGFGRVRIPRAEWQCSRHLAFSLPCEGPWRDPAEATTSCFDPRDRWCPWDRWCKGIRSGYALLP